MYTEYIKNLILKLCKQPRTFEFISKSLNGLDPIQLEEFLRKLTKRNLLVKIEDLWSIPYSEKNLSLDFKNNDSQLYLKKYMGYFDFLKIPHPLDFEWRNSTASLNYLLSLVQDINNVNDKVLFLGMPTLFGLACIKDIPQKLTLVERNRPIVRGLERLIVDKERMQILDADIFNVSPTHVGKYFSIIMDPPWYSPHFFQFMWLASQCVELGGIVGISLPPINTRPKIDLERIQWFRYCQKVGLCLENLFTQKLHYAMPFFEFNAFRAGGIKNIIPFWRKGDLALFRKIRITDVNRPLFKEQKSNWIEKEIDTVRIRVNISSNVSTEKDLIIKSIVNGDILPSVSTRDKRRTKANVWTSGNRIFEVNNPQLFVDNLGANSKLDIVNSVYAKKFVKTITSFEKKEYNNYLDWLYHEMERDIN